MKVWCIVNLVMLHDGHGNDPDMTEDVAHLDKSYGPTMIYFNKKMAEKELLRLQEQNPGDYFVLFEAVGEVKRSAENIHNTSIEDPSE